MSSFSDTLENAVLNKVFSNTDFSYPTLYIGLFKSDAGLETDELASAEEVSFDETGYTRVNITDNGGFTTATAGQILNQQDLNFPVAQADWGTITHAAIVSTDGSDAKIIAWGAMLNPRTIYNGDSIKIPAGALVIQLQ